MHREEVRCETLQSHRVELGSYDEDGEDDDRFARGKHYHLVHPDYDGLGQRYTT